MADSYRARGSSGREGRAAQGLLTLTQHPVVTLDKTVTGFSVGVESGENAGQTIFHCHRHVIPRRTFDTPDPRNGEREVIPEKQDYYYTHGVLGITVRVYR